LKSWCRIQDDPEAASHVLTSVVVSNRRLMTWRPRWSRIDGA